jgi:hypothetical protein
MVGPAKWTRKPVRLTKAGTQRAVRQYTDGEGEEEEETGSQDRVSCFFFSYLISAAASAVVHSIPWPFSDTVHNTEPINHSGRSNFWFPSHKKHRSTVPGLTSPTRRSGNTGCPLNMPQGLGRRTKTPKLPEVICNDSLHPVGETLAKAQHAQTPLREEAQRKSGLDPPLQSRQH